MTVTALRRTPLHEIHREAGGRLGAFAGWEMPIQYTGIGEEHRAVRERVGLFDVSHMGEILLDGPGALEALQRLITNDASRLSVGAGLYTPMCTPAGGIVDDLTAFRVGEDAYLLIANAGRRAADLAWIAAHAGEAAVRDLSDETALLALQGPRALPLLEAVAGTPLADLAPFHAIEGRVIAGVRTTIFRTGYTGEDGFEITCPWDGAPQVWTALADAGRAYGLAPIGLAARDTLRLEAGLMLFGQDIDETTSPLEAPLGWTVKWGKGDFIGREALRRQRAAGPTRRLVGFDAAGRVIPRAGCPISIEGQAVGAVTSGTFSPTLRRPIGLGYVPVERSAPGSALAIDVRGRWAPARVVRLPFYRRPGT